MLPRNIAAERLQRAISHTRGYAVLVLDSSGIIEQWNRGAEEIFGYEEAEAIGMNAERLFTPEDIDAGIPEKELATARADGQASDRRWQQRKNGSRFFADGLSIAAYREDGAVDGFVKILRDATSEKRAEDRVAQMQALAELAYSNRSVDRLLDELLAHLCTIFRCETSAVLLADEGGTRLHLRAAAGLDKDLERGFSIEVGSGFAGAVAARNQPLVWNEPAPDRFVSDALREKDLKAIMGVPLRVDERMIGVVHVGTTQDRAYDDDDVNLLQLAADRIALAVENARLFAAERAAAERAAFLSDAATLLASSLDYEKTLAEVARIAVPRFADWCAVDVIEGGTLRRVAAQHVDPSKVALAHEMHQKYPPRRDAPIGAYHVAQTREPELVAIITEDLIRANVANEEHYRIANALGLRSYISVPLCVRDTVLGVVTFVWAESMRSYTEDDLRFAQQLASRAALAIENARLYREARLATHARDVFLAKLSHELRTPMTSILGWVGMLKEGNLDPDTYRVALDSIEQSARLQGHLVADLLDISRTVAGKLHLELRRVDLDDVASAAIAALQPQIDVSGVRVIADLAPPGTALVDGDPERLQQVFSNLLGNALKFTPRGGLVTLRVAASADEVIATVSDTGRGIAKSLLSRVFDAFRQAEAGDNRFGGMGLGLAIVRTLVEMHDGSVEAESAGEGQGASFTVRLPRAKGTGN